MTTPTSRKAIRHAVRDLLDAQPVLRGRVYASRNYPVNGADLPVVLVYTERDAGEEVTDTITQRTIDLVVRVCVRGDADEAADDELDDLCDLVEAAVQAAMFGWLAPQPLLAQLAEDVAYRDTALSYRGEDGRQDILAAEITFGVRYASVPSGNFDDLGLVSTAFDMASPRNDPPLPASPDGQIDARADIAFNQ
ncbi:hypothetical protein ACI2S5_22425 [Ralstonia nicotianae]|uniref:hypothetical protein n=1 Tax=Ralstonia pseudosolanacearum TaxID=1310165 RepID=UPI0007C93740|nr:hypothetical protein [Ralstonia pseudosolanacearum]AXV95686.1 hypothetical protein CJO80_08835 [Ralstonia solanacearum]KAF3461428.1 hypothetical protein GO278_001984 [Ralstonia solanacearum]NKA06940.1 hypothetical protein [Ralstonia solanacearum]NKA78721.1 hypothetical protein [Ralstonia solanacearum]NKG01970.1 hypothetical protein [Ralstonia solanacearum]